MNYYEEGKKFRQQYSDIDVWPVSFSSNPDDYRDFLKGLFGYWPLHYSRRERLALDIKWILEHFCNLKPVVRKVFSGELYAVSVSQQCWDDFLAQDLEYVI
jgi:hypothetical protein